MRLDLGAVARDTATGVVRAWPWLVVAVAFRVGGDAIQTWIQLALHSPDQPMETMAAVRLGVTIVREVFDGLFVGVVVAAVLYALAVLPGGRLARGLRAWPTAFATGLIGALPLMASATVMAARFNVSIAGLVGLVLAIAAIILSVFLGYATGGAVVRGTGVVASFRDSLRLTRGHRWTLLMIAVGLTVFAGLGQYLGFRVGDAVPGDWGPTVATSLFGWTAGVLNTVVGAAVWANLDRIRRVDGPEGVAETFE